MMRRQVLQQRLRVVLGVLQELAERGQLLGAAGIALLDEAELAQGVARHLTVDSCMGGTCSNISTFSAAYGCRSSG